MKRNRNNSLFDRTLLRQSLRASFQKLDPRKMVKNPIMFTVEAVTFVMLLLIVWIAVTGNTSQGSLLYNVVVFLVLFATVLFANFAEAIAEARGKAQADSLRKTREETPAKRIDPDGLDGPQLDVQVKHIRILCKYLLICRAVSALSLKPLGFIAVQVLQILCADLLCSIVLCVVIDNRHTRLSQYTHRRINYLVILRVFLQGCYLLILPGYQHITLAILHKCGG